jgi:hypothetical protein
MKTDSDKKDYDVEPETLKDDFPWLECLLINSGLQTTPLRILKDERICLWHELASSIGDVPVPFLNQIITCIESRTPENPPDDDIVSRMLETAECMTYDFHTMTFRYRHHLKNDTQWECAHREYYNSGVYCFGYDNPIYDVRNPEKDTTIHSFCCILDTLTCTSKKICNDRIKNYFTKFVTLILDKTGFDSKKHIIDGAICKLGQNHFGVYREQPEHCDYLLTLTLYIRKRAKTIQ